MENKINYGEMTNTDIKKEDIVLTEEWDKVFPKNENVNHKKGVRFASRICTAQGNLTLLYRKNR